MAAEEGGVLATQVLKMLGTVGRIRFWPPGGLVDYTIVGRLHVLMFFMLFIAPVCSLLSWYSQNGIDYLLIHGATAKATVTGFKIIHRKGTSYSVDLSWRDVYGIDRRLESFTISASYFARIRGVKLPATVQLKYLPDEPTDTRRTVLVYDHERNQQNASVTIYLFLFWLFGLVTVPLLTHWRTKNTR
jgi:hypothetical protein